MNQELFKKLCRSAYDYADYHAPNDDDVVKFTRLQHQQLIELSVLECLKALQADKKQTKQIAEHFSLDWV